MKIRKIHIRNFRGIDELTLELAVPEDRALDLAVLAGPNGCGKTSILEACLWALKQDKLVSRKLPEQDYMIELVVENDARTATVKRTPHAHGIIDADGNCQRSINGFMQDIRVFYFSSWRTPKRVGSVGLSTGKGKGRGKRPARTDENTLWRLKQHLVNLKGSMAFDDGFVNDGEVLVGLVNFYRLPTPLRHIYYEKVLQK